MAWTCLIGGQRAKFEATGMKDVATLNSYLVEIADLLRNHQITVPVSDTYTMREIRQAHALIDTGHKKGNIVLLPGL